MKNMEFKLQVQMELEKEIEKSKFQSKNLGRIQ